MTTEPTRSSDAAIVYSDDPKTRELQRRFVINRSQIDGWLWRSRHAIRQRNVRLACESMLAAIWLMGADPR